VTKSIQPLAKEGSRHCHSAERAKRGQSESLYSFDHLARVYGERKRNFVGQHFWARGFFVNTVGRDEEAIRAYIRNQEREDQRLDQLNLWR
jgi:REP element-mobilizing transposase RayT